MCYRTDRSAKVKTEITLMLVQTEEDFAIKMLFKLAFVFIFGLSKNPISFI